MGKSGYIAIPIAIATTVVWEKFAIKNFHLELARMKI